MSEGYTLIPNAIIEESLLPPMEKLTLIYLLKCRSSEKGYAYPSLETIRKMLGYSHNRYVIKILNALIEKGYISKQTIRQRNHYFIHLDRVQNVPNVSEIPNVQKVHNLDVQSGPKVEVQKVHELDVQNVPKVDVQNVPHVPNVPYVQKVHEGSVQNVHDGYVQIVHTKNTKKNNKKNTNSKSVTALNLETLVTTYTANPELKETLMQFIKHRQGMKKPFSTDHAFKLLLTHLDKLASNDGHKKAILEQSIVNGWQGIFELKANLIEAPREKSRFSSASGKERPQDMTQRRSEI